MSDRYIKIRAKPARKPLGLKRSVEPGEVKQTFSHGRTNKVVVEVKRRKLVGKPGAQEACQGSQERLRPPHRLPWKRRKPAPAPKQDDALTRQEMQAKLAARSGRSPSGSHGRSAQTRCQGQERTRRRRRETARRRKSQGRRRSCSQRLQEEIAAAEEAAADASAEAASRKDC